MSRVLVTGGRGQLGHDLERRWPERHPGDELLPLSHHELDVTDAEAVRRLILAQQPSIVINLAAYHVVDEVEGNPAKAFAVNAIGPRNVALACKEAGAIMVHLSTDYVFTDSSNHRPHVEDEPVNPPNVYGVSKAAGEMMIGPSWPSHFIVRGSGLYGVAGSSGKGGRGLRHLPRDLPGRVQLVPIRGGDLPPIRLGPGAWADDLRGADHARQAAALFRTREPQPAAAGHRRDAALERSPKALPARTVSTSPHPDPPSEGEGDRMNGESGRESP
ncbi:MAG: sugar nucleotide-binding protein [Chloroflexi bacterium]|nr:MAG: sugar nucleotide-binding protein [Chloroflexota bacterium]